MHRSRRAARRRFWAIPAACLGIVGVPGPASALEARVDASYDAQYYSLRSPFGEPVLSRRRYTATLGLQLFAPGPRPESPSLQFHSRLRLDSDFGVTEAERRPGSLSYVPGITEPPLDLMVAYLEGQGYLHSVLGFRLGRQIQVDSLGFWSFDGGLLSLTLPAFIRLSGYAGFEQRAGLSMLGTARYSADGVYRGSRRELEQAEYPSFLEESAWAPAAGASLETHGLSFVHARIDYRKVMNRSPALVTPFPEPGVVPESHEGLRASSERVGSSVQASLPSLGAASGTVVYDLFVERFSQYELSLDGFLSPSVTVGADVEHFLPVFDGDSIFNFFTQFGRTEARGRVTIAPSRAWDLSASGGLGWSFTEGDPEGDAETSGAPSRKRTRSSAEGLGSLGARYRFGTGSLGLDATAEGGESRHLVGGDLSLRRVYGGGAYDSLTLLSLYDWSDALRPTRDALGLTYVLGVGASPFDVFSHRGRIGAEWEHSMNRLVGHRFRMLLTLDLTVLE